MPTFRVPDEYSLGEAIWLSKPSDTIEIMSGNYGRIIVKGCNIKFPEDYSATAQQIFGVEGNCTITNYKNQDNIKSIFVFRKVLPFHVRLQENESFFHPSGTEIKIIGHDKPTFDLNVNSLSTAYEVLPKSIVDVIVPSLDEIDFDTLESVPDFNNFDLIQKRMVEEQKVNNLMVGHGSNLPFGEIEYIALWALNHFIRQYSKIAGIREQKGLSFSAFRDGLLTGYGRASASEFNLHRHLYIDQFNGLPCSREDVKQLFELCLSSPDYSISEYIEYELNYLNYSMATVGMAQLLEIKAGSGKAKWQAIENSRLGLNEKRYLTEILIARNVILHQNECAIKQNADGFREAQKQFGVSDFSEYRIYETKRPWFWYYDALIPFTQDLEN